MASPVVMGVVYRGKKKDGDFNFMIKRPEHANSVFIICENVHDMILSTENGGGTAVLRDSTWPNSDTPRAVGIPTGWSQETGGFRVLVKEVCTLIDLAIDRVVVQTKHHLLCQP